MFRSTLCIAFVLLLAVKSNLLSAEPTPLDAARLEEIGQLLPETPRGLGPTIEDRAAWDVAAGTDSFKRIVRRAEQLLTQPIPELTDELFLDYSKTGNRTRCQAVLSQRHSRVSYLVLAECLENRGRFLPAIEEAIRAVCSEKTWVLPAHDRRLANFEGKKVEIDLAVARVSWNLATADYWLGDKLGGETRQLIRNELSRRTFGPFQSMVRTGKPRMWWLWTTNNWNAVCLAGVTGSALAMIDDPETRAFHIAAADKYIQNFLQGFTPDGYCSEGLAYWNYGFGHFVMLAETIHQATGGKIDWLADPRIEQIARFARRMEITQGIYPALADCPPSTRPDTQTMAYLSRRYEWGLKETEDRGLLLAGGPSASLFSLGLFGFANSACQVPTAEDSPPLPPRDWFPDAGILICRPSNPTGMGVALKGGHNGEHHNHNDIGSFLVVLGNQTPLVDPGGEVYTARTFSSKRYDSGVLNSFGHPVPRIAGKLQRTGRSAAAKVLATEFTDNEDTLSLDLTSAYPVRGLKSLTRTFTFRRDGRGQLTIVDHLRAEQPESFETALVTFSPWKQLEPNRLLVGEGTGAVEVTIDTSGKAFEVRAEEIDEDLPGRRIPTRLGIQLQDPTADAKITLTIVPAE